jgi:hypothetical protein
MTTHDPGTPEPLDLSAPDEEFVRGLLAGLPAVAVPPDLSERLDAALREAARLPAAAPTVVPLAGRARRAASTRLLEIAAAVLVLAVGTVAGVKALSGSGDHRAVSTAAAAAAATTQSALTHSGHVYTDATLVTDVRALAAGRPLTAGPPLSTDTGGVAARGSTGTPYSAASPTARSPEATGPGSAPSPQTRSPGPLFTSAAALVPCLAAVEDGLPAAVQPVALDQGSYQGLPVLVVVLPGSVDPQTTYDVFVVGAGCGQANDAHLVFYRSVPRS